MADATVAADFGQALDIHRHIAAQVALHGVLVADDLTQLGLLGVGQVLHAGIGVDARLLEDLARAGAANAINIGESDLDSLFLRQINAGNTCHTLCPSFNLVSACAWGFRKWPWLCPCAWWSCTSRTWAWQTVWLSYR